tara:strand:+ start:79 stop:534 length:456 start_codon:yes stop_codon:yes gene_type:complete
MPNDHNFYVQLINNYIVKTFPDNEFYWESDLKIHPNVPKIPISNPDKPGERLIKVPDLIAVDCDDSSFTIMGEAKTYHDYLNDLDRVNKQLDYYFNRLKYKKNGFLVYSLPHPLKINVSNLIYKKRQYWDANHIDYVVITNLENAIEIFKK